MRLARTLAPPVVAGFVMRLVGSLAPPFVSSFGCRVSSFNVGFMGEGYREGWDKGGLRGRRKVESGKLRVEGGRGTAEDRGAQFKI